MIENIKYTSNSISYDTLIEIMGFRFIRVQLGVRKCRSYPSSMFLPQDTVDECVVLLEFLSLGHFPNESGEIVSVTDQSCTIRLSNYYEKQLLQLLKNNSLQQNRPDSVLWIENFTNEVCETSSKGNPKSHYYPIGDFKELFKVAKFQRAAELEFGISRGEGKASIFVVHNSDDIKNNLIDFSYNQYELDKLEFAERERRDNWIDRKDDYDINTWMDNPDDIWNID
jgi:hypothetical protein